MMNSSKIKFRNFKMESSRIFKTNKKILIVRKSYFFWKWDFGLGIKKLRIIFPSFFYWKKSQSQKNPKKWKNPEIWDSVWLYQIKAMENVLKVQKSCQNFLTSSQLNKMFVPNILKIKTLLSYAWIFAKIQTYSLTFHRESFASNQVQRF